MAELLVVTYLMMVVVIDLVEDAAAGFDVIAILVDIVTSLGPRVADDMLGNTDALFDIGFIDRVEFRVDHATDAAEDKVA